MQEGVAMSKVLVARVVVELAVGEGLGVADETKTRGDELVFVVRIAWVLALSLVYLKV